MLALILALVLTPFVDAHEMHFPAIYRVSGLEAGEVLTVLERPDPASNPIGFLPPDGQDIEVVTMMPETGWAKINTIERAGWVESRFLELSDSIWERETAPDFLTCLGQDPTWWLQVSGSTVELSIRSEFDHGMEISEVLVPLGDMRPSRIIRAENALNSAMISISEGRCALHTGGREYGISTNVLLKGRSESAFVTGCCTLAR